MINPSITEKFYSDNRQNKIIILGGIYVAKEVYFALKKSYGFVPYSSNNALPNDLFNQLIKQTAQYTANKIT